MLSLIVDITRFLEVLGVFFFLSVRQNLSLVKEVSPLHDRYTI